MPVALWNDAWYDDLAIYSGSATLVDGNPVLVYAAVGKPKTAAYQFNYGLAVHGAWRVLEGSTMILHARLLLGFEAQPCVRLNNDLSGVRSLTVRHCHADDVTGVYNLSGVRSLTV
jgi:hypothetical protein